MPGDTNTGNNTSGPVTITVRCADVGVVKTPDGATISAGQTATFTIVVTNDGPGVATGVTLTDALPDAATWTVVTTPAGLCPATATGTLNLRPRQPGRRRVGHHHRQPDDNGDRLHHANQCRHRRRRE